MLVKLGIISPNFRIEHKTYFETTTQNRQFNLQNNSPTDRFPWNSRRFPLLFTTIWGDPVIRGSHVKQKHQGWPRAPATPRAFCSNLAPDLASLVHHHPLKGKGIIKKQKHLELTCIFGKKCETPVFFKNIGLIILAAGWVRGEVKQIITIDFSSYSSWTNMTLLKKSRKVTSDRINLKPLQLSTYDWVGFNWWLRHEKKWRPNLWYVNLWGLLNMAEKNRVTWCYFTPISGVIGPYFTL